MTIRRKNQPGCPCCGVECSACKNQIAPAEFRLVIAGLSDGPGGYDPCYTPCTCSSNLNRTVIVAGPNYWCFGYPPGTCGWKYESLEFEDPCCHDTSMCWQVHINASYIYVNIQSGVMATVVRFYKEYDSPPDCIHFSDEEIPYTSDGYHSYCVSSDGTPAKLTAL
jgi:hypothetical protein